MICSIFYELAKGDLERCTVSSAEDDFHLRVELYVVLHWVFGTNRVKAYFACVRSAAYFCTSLLFAHFAGAGVVFLQTRQAAHLPPKRGLRLSWRCRRRHKSFRLLGLLRWYKLYFIEPKSAIQMALRRLHQFLLITLIADLAVPRVLICTKITHPLQWST